MVMWCKDANEIIKVGVETKGTCGYNLRSWHECPLGNVDRRLVNGARAWIDQNCTTRSPKKVFTFERMNHSCWKSK